jgi:hypothetical protein
MTVVVTVSSFFYGLHGFEQLHLLALTADGA